MKRRYKLTDRELDILKELARTGSTIEIAAHKLNMDYQTAKNHLSDAYSVLEVRGLVAAFIKLGWLHTEDANKTCDPPCGDCCVEHPHWTHWHSLDGL